jgi:hypothetical protein
MPTNTAGSVARNLTVQAVHYLRKRVTVAQQLAGLVTVTVGTIPSGAVIIAPISGVDVNTVFNAGTNNRVNIGITGTTAKYAANSSLLTAGFVAMAVAVGHRVAADTTIIATLDVTGTAATTGDFDIVIAYTVDNDTQ